MTTYRHVRVWTQRHVRRFTYVANEAPLMHRGFALHQCFVGATIRDSLCHIVLRGYVIETEFTIDRAMALIDRWWRGHCRDIIPNTQFVRYFDPIYRYLESLMLDPLEGSEAQWWNDPRCRQRPPC